MVRVDAEQGTPLPEHACGEDGGYISLLKRVERCCIESNSAEIERAIAALSLKPKSDQVGDVATAEASQEAEGGGRRGMFKREAFLGVMSPPVAEAAFSACRAALLLCTGDYEKLLRETALFSPCTVSLAAGSSSGAVQGDPGNPAADGDVRARVRSFVLGVEGGNMVDETTVASEVCESFDPVAVDATNSVGASSNVAEESLANHGAKTDTCGRNDGKTTPGADAAAMWRAAEVMWAGAAALSLFWQENYSGPELGPERLSSLEVFFTEKCAPLCGREAGGGSAQDAANVALACDGELPYPNSSLAGSLLLARVILSSLEEGGSGRGGSWSDSLPSSSVKLPEKNEESNDDDKMRRVSKDGGSLRDAAGGLSTAAWWAGRACLTHARLFLSSDRSETLWRETVGLFSCTVSAFGGGVVSEAGAEAGSGKKKALGVEERLRRRVAGRVWLEWGLAQHYFQVRQEIPT